MISRPSLLVLGVLLTGSLFAADEPALPSTAKDMLRARLAEETPAAPAKPATTGPAAPATPTSPPTAPASPAAALPDHNAIVASAPATTATDSTTAKPKPAPDPATVMPKVEVKRPRITVLDQQLAQQDQAIAREKQNTKPTEVDKALNDSKIAKPLAIFGGESSQFRQHVSSERVSLMEDEKDLIEAIAHAKTKEEKAELKKQLDALRAERRELEKALR